MNIKILVATHKKYDMPNDNCYFPIQVGKEGKKLSLDYQEDNTGDNISYKNKYYCELTGLYWGWKNSNSDYIGLAHYRRHFSNKNLLFRTFNEKSNCVLTDKEIQDLLNKYEVILPKKESIILKLYILIMHILIMQII